MKGCGIFAAIAFVGLALFCALGAFAVRRGVERAKEAEAKMTPQEKAEREAKAKADRDEYKLFQSQERLIKTLVTDSLKAPATAKFQLVSKWNKDELITNGYVDAQNSLGANVRTKIHALSVGRQKSDLVFLMLDDKILIDQVSQPR